jgi:monoamine oxidase
MSEPKQVDVVIIGGGLAGLTAAYALKTMSSKENPVSFVVLEAGAQPGGRVSTHPEDFFDFGAGYIAGDGGSQSFVQLLVRQLNLPTFPQFLPRDKDWLYQTGKNALQRFPGDNPRDFPGGLNALELLGELDQQAALVHANLQNLRNIPFAEAWDGISVRDWLDAKLEKKEITQDTHDVTVVSVRSALSVEPEDVSFLFLLYYAAAAGSYSALIDVTGGPSAAEGTRLTFGSQSLVSALQEEVQDSIVVGAKVTMIQEDGPTELVTTEGAGSFSCGRVIVAMSPPNSNKITFHPRLRNRFNSRGQAREELQTSMKLGRSIKGFVRYKRPFWREKGLMGYFLAAGGDFAQFPVDWTLDNSWEPPIDQRTATLARPQNRYSLMTFIVGAAADYWSRPENAPGRAEAVIKHLEFAYGPEARSELIDSVTIANSYADQDWSTSFVGGGPTGVLGRNGLISPAGASHDGGPALTHVLGPFHWAGTESADEWPGYMNGAIQSGFRAAGEVLTALLAAKASGAKAAGTASKLR